MLKRKKPQLDPTSLADAMKSVVQEVYLLSRHGFECFVFKMFSIDELKPGFHTPDIQFAGAVELFTRSNGVPYAAAVKDKNTGLVAPMALEATDVDLKIQKFAWTADGKDLTKDLSKYAAMIVRCNKQPCEDKRKKADVRCCRVFCNLAVSAMVNPFTDTRAEPYCHFIEEVVFNAAELDPVYHQEVGGNGPKARTS